MKHLKQTLLLAVVMASPPAASTVLAATTAVPAPITVAQVEDFLKEGGLQACRVEKLNPSVSTWHGTVASMWVEIAADCTHSDSDNPDVAHVHQFNNTEDRDKMVSRYRSSMPRGINLRAGIWPVGDYYAVALIGPNMNKYRQLLQTVYEKRQAAAAKK